jgi:hypothetical protein
VSGDYLWDKSGRPDPETERLERVLAPLRHRGSPPYASLAPRVRRSRPLGGVLASLAAAAGLVAALGAAFQLFPRGGFEVARLAGAPRIGDSVVAGEARLHVGEWLSTDAASRARVTVGRLGIVEIEPGTRLGLVDSGRRAHRLTMPRGVLRAKIEAPPGEFVVDTPSATAVDLGCEYRLEVDEAGAGFLSVVYGYVAFEWRGRESFVPAGAQCLTRRGVGPGTPFYAGASERFKRSLEALDFDARDAGERLGLLLGLLADARRDDALTLWHLLSRVEPDERGLVYDRLAELLLPPPDVTREGVLRGDRAMLDSWWDRLELGSMRFWRRWKQRGLPFAR